MNFLMKINGLILFNLFDNLDQFKLCSNMYVLINLCDSIF